MREKPASDGYGGKYLGETQLPTRSQPQSATQEHFTYTNTNHVNKDQPPDVASGAQTRRKDSVNGLGNLYERNYFQTTGAEPYRLNIAASFGWKKEAHDTSGEEEQYTTEHDAEKYGYY